MDNKRKRTSTDAGDHIEKKSKQSTVTDDANGTSSSKMTDCEIISLMVPNALPNCVENPERNPQVHRARIGESVHGEISGNRTEIIFWDSNEPAIAHQSGNEAVVTPTTTTNNSILPDDGIDERETNSSGSNFDVIAELTSEDDDISSYHSTENHEISPYYSIENDEEIIDETSSGSETISEDSISMIRIRISISGQHQPLFTSSVLGNNIHIIADLTSEDDDTNSYNSIENDDE